MALPCVREYTDDLIGKIYVNYGTPSAPVALSSATAGLTDIIKLDYNLMPVGSPAVPNPWKLKWRCIGGYSQEQMDIFCQYMEMRVQYSTDDTTYVDLADWSIKAYKDMTGCFGYKVDLADFPRYVRVVGKIFPKTDGTATSMSILMGMVPW